MTPSAFDKNTSEQLQPIIQAVADRIHYAEGRRTNYTVMAVALIAGGISILVFAFGAIGQLWLKYASLVAAIGFVAVGLAVLVVYGRQTNQYPYTSATKTWKWFYRDALPDRTAFALKSCEGSKAQKQRITDAYKNQLPQFKSTIAQLRDEQVSADQDVEQLYSLHVNELYKNPYLSNLRTIFNRGLISTRVIAIMAGAAAAYIETKESSIQTLIVGDPNWSGQIDYQLLSAPPADNLDIAFHASIRNKNATAKPIKGIVLMNRSGWPLPAQIKFSREFSSPVLPARLPKAMRSKATISCTEISEV